MSQVGGKKKWRGTARRRTAGHDASRTSQAVMHDWQNAAAQRPQRRLSAAGSKQTGQVASSPAAAAAAAMSVVV